jgi:hypothetical protein
METLFFIRFQHYLRQNVTFYRQAMNNQLRTGGSLAVLSIRSEALPVAHIPEPEVPQSECLFNLAFIRRLVTFQNCM